MRSKVTRIKIEKQGAPIVNNAIIIKKSKDLVAIDVDLKSKYCNVGAHVSGSDGKCSILIDANKDSLYLDETHSKDDSTELSFLDFKGWSVWATSSGRYSLYVCLIKNLY